MKRSSAGRLIISMVLVGVILGMAFFQFEEGSAVTVGMPFSTSIVDLVHHNNGFSRTATPGGEFGDCFIVPRNLSASLNYDFSEKQSLPLWGKVSGSKQRNSTGFFFAFMVLLLFSRFYQRSRTSSEDDGDSSQNDILKDSHWIPVFGLTVSFNNS